MKTVLVNTPFKKIMAIVIILSILVSGSLVTWGGIMAQSSSPAYEEIVFPSGYQGYYFDDLKPNHILYMQYEQYKRFGPGKNAIEANKDLFIFPESSILKIRAKIGEKGNFYDIYQTVASTAGELAFTYSSEDASQLIITNYLSKKQYKVSYEAQKQIPLEGLAATGARETLINQGWEQKGEGMLNGRRTAVYSLMEPVSEPQKPPKDGDYIAPVVYDLDPVYYRSEIQLDDITGAVLQILNYVVDDSGTETLIERFTLVRSYLE